MGRFNSVFLAVYALQSICVYVAVGMFAGGRCLGCESLSIDIAYISQSIQRVANDNGIATGCAAVVLLFVLAISLIYAIAIIMAFGKSGLSDGGNPMNNALFMFFLSICAFALLPNISVRMNALYVSIAIMMFLSEAILDTLRIITTRRRKGDV